MRRSVAVLAMQQPRPRVHACKTAVSATDFHATESCQARRARCPIMQPKTRGLCYLILTIMER